MATDLSLTFSEDLGSPHPDLDEVARLSLRISRQNVVSGSGGPIPVVSCVYFPPELPLKFDQPVSVTISSTQLLLNGEQPLEIVLRVPWQYTQYVSMACVTTQIVVEEDVDADLQGQRSNGEDENDLEDDNGEKDDVGESRKGTSGDDKHKYQKVGKQ